MVWVNQRGKKKRLPAKYRITGNVAEFRFFHFSSSRWYFRCSYGWILLCTWHPLHTSVIFSQEKLFFLESIFIGDSEQMCYQKTKVNCSKFTSVHWSCCLMCLSIFEQTKIGLAFNSNDEHHGIIELSHKTKVLQKANSRNSKLFILFHPFLLSVFLLLFVFSPKCYECSLFGCVYLRLTLTTSNLDFQWFQCFFFQI